MYAYVVEQANGHFVWVELPRPTVSENDVLIRIQASGVNPLDTKTRAGAAAHAKQPLPAVLGLDMAGTVEEVGRASPNSNLGMRSMAWSAASAAFKARWQNLSQRTQT